MSKEKPVAFEIPMERPTTPGGPSGPPKRLSSYSEDKEPLSPRDIKDKLDAAEQRREVNYY